MDDPIALACRLNALPEAFLQHRQNAIRIAADRMWRGSREPIPFLPEWPGIYRPIPDGLNLALAAKEETRDEQIAAHRGRHYQPTRKCPTERLATMLRKARALIAEMKMAQLSAVFNLKRQQYYTLSSEARRYAKEQRLPAPDLPAAPVNPFPVARPRGRWLNQSDAAEACRRSAVS